MITPRLVIDLMPLNLTALDFYSFPTRYGDAFQARLPTLKSDVLTHTAVTPGPPSYPLTPKMTPLQRRAFWATNGFGRGIPTPRMQEPGGVLGGYDVTLTRTIEGGEAALTNDYPGAVYIVGEFQQPFHADTGWIKVDTVQSENEALAWNTAQLALDDVL